MKKLLAALIFGLFLISCGGGDFPVSQWENTQYGGVITFSVAPENKAALIAQDTTVVGEIKKNVFTGVTDEGKVETLKLKIEGDVLKATDSEGQEMIFLKKK